MIASLRGTLVDFTADPLPATLVASAQHAVSVGLLDQAEIDAAGGLPGTLYDVTAIGNAIVDVIARCSDEFLIEEGQRSVPAERRLQVLTRAAEWSERGGHWQDAIDYALAADAAPLAAGALGLLVLAPPGGGEEQLAALARAEALPVAAWRAT